MTPDAHTRPTILHCLSDYPDPIGPATAASLRVLAATTHALTHNVYSFRRAGWRGDITSVTFDDAAGQGHRAMVYGALPKGLEFSKKMDLLAKWIIADAQARGLKPDLVHAHKLTLDGLVGAQVAAHFGVPLVVTIQANTDVRIIDTRRDLRAAFTDIWQKAVVALPFSPIAVDLLTKRLGPRQGPTPILPCPPGSNTVLAPVVRAAGSAPRIVTAFHLEHWKNKNIRALFQALRDVPEAHLDLIGGGHPESFLRLSQMAEDVVPGRVHMLGNCPAAQVQACMNGATAFALLSHRESYGMVYAEALLAGTPCLHSKGRGFDGMFEDGTLTLGADPSDVAAITAALRRLIEEEDAFKARIRTAQDTGQLDILQAHTISETYIQQITAACAAPQTLVADVLA